MRRIAILVCLLGCDDGGEGEVVDAESPMSNDAGENCLGATLDVVAVDAWGRPVTATFSVDGASGARPTLTDAGSWSIEVSADDHHPVTTTATWDGRFSPDAMALDGAFTAVALDPADGDACWTYSLFVGLEHVWFESSARPWHPGNDAELFGEAGPLWIDIAAEIAGARESVFWATWWWSSDLELLRGDDLTEPEESRRANTSLEILRAASARTEVRVLINQFLGDLVEGGAFITSDLPIREHGEDNGDAIQVMTHANRDDIPATEPYSGLAPEVDFGARIRAAYPDRNFGLVSETSNLEPTFPAASYHMKGVIVDHQTAYVVGTNTQQDYWDDAEHQVFNPLRMEISATAEERQAVADRARLPDLVPFKDYGIKLNGPVVGEVERYYAALWNQAMAHPEAFAADGTAYEPPAHPGRAGTLAMQIQTTLPPPMAQQSIWRGQEKAIRNAQRYILIEDQYWRAGRVLDELVEAMENNPELVMIVVTNDISRTDGGKKYTYEMDQAFQAQFADRYVLLQLRAFDVQTGAEAADGQKALHDISIYNHSKLMIIDDIYLTVGSANKNNRSLLYDGEMNAVVIDDKWVKTEARRVVEQWLGPVKAPGLPADLADAVPYLRDVAEQNLRTVDGWKQRFPDLSDADIIADQSQRPAGHLFPLVITEGYQLEVGPDFF